jgi:hypothetical protein
VPEAILNGQLQRCVEIALGYADEHVIEVYSDHDRLDTRMMRRSLY